MKNMKRFLTLCLALCMVLSVAVFAEAGAPGTIKEITADGADYDDGDVNFALTYDDATENGMYLILVLSEEGTPKNGNILYVNQVTADADGAYFENVYPTEIGEEESYIYLAGTDMEYTKLGKIIPNVEEVLPTAGMKGDVDLDEDVDMDDVVALMCHVLKAATIADETALANGEVTNDDALSMDDVVKIMCYVLKAISSLD